MNPEKLTLYAEHQHVVGRIIRWDEVFGEGNSLAVFGKDSVLHAPDQEIGRADRTIILEVVVAGPGNVSRGERNVCALDTGDLVVVNYIHRSHSLTVLGESVSSFNWEQVMAKIVVDKESKSIDLVPLQCYLVCERDEEAAQILIMGKSKIILPGADSQFSGAADTDHRGRPTTGRTKTVVERVVSVGPGAVVDGLWQEPPPLAGMHVMYDTSVAPIRFMVGGKSYTLVHWRHVILSFRREEGDAVEQSGPRLTGASQSN